MSEVLNFATLAANTLAQRDALQARVSGKAPAPDPDPVVKDDKVTPEAIEVLGNLSETEREALITKAEGGDSVALDIIEKALETAQANSPQAGDLGGRAPQGQAVNPWELAEQRIRKAIATGRRRQNGR